MKKLILMLIGATIGIITGLMVWIRLGKADEEPVRDELVADWLTARFNAQT